MHIVNLRSPAVPAQCAHNAHRELRNTIGIREELIDAPYLARGGGSAAVFHELAHSTSLMGFRVSRTEIGAAELNRSLRGKRKTRSKGFRSSSTGRKLENPLRKSAGKPYQHFTFGNYNNARPACVSVSFVA